MNGYPTYIMSNGTSTLWSWGNYRYTIDAEGYIDCMIMNDTTVEEAIEAFQMYYGELEEQQ